MTILLGGEQPAANIRNNLQAEIKKLKADGITPKLAIVLVANNPTENSYVKNKLKIASRLGLEAELISFDEDCSQEQVVNTILKLNQDKSVNGIICQLPLPKQIDSLQIAKSIDPLKDVDCLNPDNLGRLALGSAELTPCTPSGILELLKHYQLDLKGKGLLIIGRSNIVGKPLALMALNPAISATVTIAHSKTKNLDKLLELAQVIVVAVGKPHFLSAQKLRPDAIIIDVGINRISKAGHKKLVGDVDYNQVKARVKAISPVPGGVGLLTVSMLMRNLVLATRAQNRDI